MNFHGQRDEHGVRHNKLPHRVLLLAVVATLAGCGDEDSRVPYAQQAAGHAQQHPGYPSTLQQPQAYAGPYQPSPWGTPPVVNPPVPAPPPTAWPPANIQSMPGMQSGQAQQMAPSGGTGYSPPDNPWLRPPAGFGARMGMGGASWPGVQPQPVMPQFRPLEPQSNNEPSRTYQPAIQQPVAPYDRPIGSSRETPQMAWPGYYPGYPGGYGAPPPVYGGAGMPPGVGWPTW